MMLEVRVGMGGEPMKRILIVDDEPNLLRLYARELTDAGYEVETAEDGFEALRLATQRKPDCVVMDIRMQGMDGLETITRLLDQYKDLPVVINSAYSSPKDNFLSWCANAYVMKSADLSELKAQVAEALAHAN